MHPGSSGEMLRLTWSSLSTDTKRILKTKLQIYTKPAMTYAHCYALCRASTLLLTTRMPELWLCVSMCGFGIGVVFQSHLSFVTLSQ
jgi:hypothetical protein